MTQRAFILAASRLCKRILDFMERNPQHWPIVEVIHENGETTIAAKCSHNSDDFCWKICAKNQESFRWSRPEGMHKLYYFFCDLRPSCAHFAAESVCEWLIPCAAAPSLYEMETYEGTFAYFGGYSRHDGSGCLICHRWTSQYHYYCGDPLCKRLVLNFLRSSFVLWAVSADLVDPRLPRELWTSIIEFMAAIISKDGRELACAPRKILAMCE